MSLLFLIVLLLPGPVWCQLPGGSPPLPSPSTAESDDQDRAALIQSVRKAHGGTSRPVLDFLADIAVTPETTNQDSLTVRLRVRYLDNRKFGQFALNEDGVTVEMGRDRRGFWYRGKDGTVQALGDLDTETERQDITRYLSLCRQLIRFLEPSTLIEQLEQPGPVEQEDLKVGPNRTLPCRSIRGRIPSMPVYHRSSPDPTSRHDKEQEPSADPDQPGPAQVQLLFDQDSHRLVALRVTPIRPDGQPARVAEAIRILSYTERGDRLIPDKLRIASEVVQDGRLVRARVEIKLDEFRANSGFRPTDLDRPR